MSMGGLVPFLTLLPLGQKAVILLLSCDFNEDIARCLHLMQATQLRITRLAGIVCNPLPALQGLVHSRNPQVINTGPGGVRVPAGRA